MFVSRQLPRGARRKSSFRTRSAARLCRRRSTSTGHEQSFRPKLGPPPTGPSSSSANEPVPLVYIGPLLTRSLARSAVRPKGCAEMGHKRGIAICATCDHCVTKLLNCGARNTVPSEHHSHSSQDLSHLRGKNHKRLRNGAHIGRLETAKKLSARPLKRSTRPHGQGPKGLLRSTATDGLGSMPAGDASAPSATSAGAACCGLVAQSTAHHLADTDPKVCLCSFAGR